MTSHDFPYGPRRYNVYCSSTFKWKEETYYCKNILDGVNVYAIDAIYAKNEESLVKTAFPLGNENTAWCLWATVEEQVQGFFWGLRAPRGQEPLSQSTPPPHFRHSSLIKNNDGDEYREENSSEISDCNIYRNVCQDLM